MDLIKEFSGEDCLIICENSRKEQFTKWPKEVPQPKIISPEELPTVQESSHDSILLDVTESQITKTLLRQLLKLGKPGSKLIITKVNDADNVEFLLKTSGFTGIELKKIANGTSITSVHPKYEVGSATKLNLKKPTAVWKLDDDDDDETIDPDVLLDDDDLKKPDPSSLRVCGTTGKRKACKDCSCGLADELAAETQKDKVVDTSNAPKSSCGSCYLGDAFRCSTCPYLGMPAFKPGEKVQLTDGLLKADV